MDMMLTSQELLDKILATLAAGKRVVIRSYTRPVIYDKRHATMFRACTNGDRGIRIGWPGKRSVYATEGMLGFEQ